MNCPSCNFDVQEGAAFCDYCGFDLRDAAPIAPSAHAPSPQHNGGDLICPQCNFSNIIGAAFCENCGAQLEQAAISETPPIQKPPEASEPPQGAGDISCSQCGHVNVPGSVFCENCGASLAPQPEQVTPPEPPKLDIQESKPEVDQQEIISEPQVHASPTPENPRFVIQGSDTSLDFTTGSFSFVVGREDPVSGIFPEINLEPHGGHNAGVGRQHTKIIIQGNQVLIEDLNSVNGTYLNKVQSWLKEYPNESYSSAASLDNIFR